MGKLCIYLPPFASDYTGVCAALFPMNCLTVINDASCCTGHFVHYEEPRWFRLRQPVFSTQLRGTDAVFGNDAKVRDCVLRAAAEVDSDLIALIGTPVPAMTGMDMTGIACEIEAGCGKPTLGFNTTGFEYYDRGIFAAGSALIDRFCVAPSGAPEGARGGVNVLGMTPPDYGDVGNDAALAAALRASGLEVNAMLFCGASLSELKNLAQAACSLAVSAAGLLLAKKLQRHFGTPFLARSPMGSAHLDTVLRRLKGGEVEIRGQDGGEKLLLIGDQVMMHSLREALYLAGCRAQISTASFFHMDRQLQEPGDFQIASERDLSEQLAARAIDRLICDPRLCRLPAIAARPHRDFVHPAVSSRLEWAGVPRFLSRDFDAWLLEAASWGGAEV